MSICRIRKYCLVKCGIIFCLYFQPDLFAIRPFYGTDPLYNWTDRILHCSQCDLIRFFPSVSKIIISSHTESILCLWLQIFAVISKTVCYFRHLLPEYAAILFCLSFYQEICKIRFRNIFPSQAYHRCQCITFSHLDFGDTCIINFIPSLEQILAYISRTVPCFRLYKILSVFIARCVQHTGCFIVLRLHFCQFCPWILTVFSNVENKAVYLSVIIPFRTDLQFTIYSSRIRWQSRQLRRNCILCYLQCLRTITGLAFPSIYIYCRHSVPVTVTGWYGSVHICPAHRILYRFQCIIIACVCTPVNNIAGDIRTVRKIPGQKDHIFF